VIAIQGHHDDVKPGTSLEEMMLSPVGILVISYLVITLEDEVMCNEMFLKIIRKLTILPDKFKFLFGNKEIFTYIICA
jgi:hypothetical protein